MRTIKEIIYNFNRNLFKKHITRNLGDVIEQEDKIVCYVDLDKAGIKNKAIGCSGIKKEDKELAKYFNLDKPISYVIDGFYNYDSYLSIFGYENCEVIIRNCDFKYGIFVYVNGNCTLENTTIATYDKLVIGCSDTLTIKDMKNDQIRLIEPIATINFTSDNKIIIEKSSIGTSKNNSFEFKTKELELLDSNITGEVIKSNSNQIKADSESSLTATERVVINADEFDSIKINSPKIVFNNEEMVNEKRKIIFKKINDPLTMKRLELINLLNTILTESEETIKEELSTKPIRKVLSRNTPLDKKNNKD